VAREFCSRLVKSEALAWLVMLVEESFRGLPPWTDDNFSKKADYW